MAKRPIFRLFDSKRKSRTLANEMFSTRTSQLELFTTRQSFEYFQYSSGTRYF